MVARCSTNTNCYKNRNCSEENRLYLVFYDTEMHFINIYQRENFSLFTLGEDFCYSFYGIDELLEFLRKEDFSHKNLESEGIFNISYYQPVTTTKCIPQELRSIGILTSGHRAVLLDDVTLLQILFEANPESVNYKDRNGRTPLHLLCLHPKKQFRKTMKILLYYQANIFARDRFGFTAFMYACKSNRKELVKMLIEYNNEIVVSLNIENYETALHIAVANGHKQIVQILLKNGALSLQENFAEESSIDIALNDENFEMVDLLTRSLYKRTAPNRFIWFHRHVDRNTAESMILELAQKLETSSGVYLVRYSSHSSTENCQRVISLLVENIVRHYLITTSEVSSHLF